MLTRTAQDLKASMDVSLRGGHQDVQDALDDALQLADKQDHHLSEWDRMVLRSRIKDIKETVALMEAHLKI